MDTSILNLGFTYAEDNLKDFDQIIEGFTKNDTMVNPLTLVKKNIRLLYDIVIYKEINKVECVLIGVLIIYRNTKYRFSYLKFLEKDSRTNIESKKYSMLLQDHIKIIESDKIIENSVLFIKQNLQTKLLNTFKAYKDKEFEYSFVNNVSLLQDILLNSFE